MTNNFKHTNHSYLRYANCWEDADVLLSALNIQPSDSVISIGSAGDNTFSILSKSPNKVLAVDINSAQLFLIELKKACFLRLNHTEFLSFLGFTNCNDHLTLFDKLKPELSLATLAYWELNFNIIESGLIDQGKFENYFNLFNSKILPLVHSKKKVNALFKNKSNQEQSEFYSKKWNTWRWRFLFSFFFSRKMMAKFGRDKSLFNEVKLNVKNYLLEQARNEIKSDKCQSNFFLHYVLTGSFGSHLPHYARLENFESIKSNCHKLVIKQGLIEDVLNSDEKYDKFNLSNIFEYININDFKSIANKLAMHSNPKAITVDWNLMVKRKLNLISNSFQILDSTQLKEKDLGFFYSELNIHQIKNESNNLQSL